MKLSNLSPFQCFLVNGVESILVNFGTVVCPTTQGVNNIFIPEINNKQLKRFREQDFSTNNLIALSSENEIISLKINLEDISVLVGSHVDLWERVVLGGSQGAFEEMINRSMNLELQRDYFNDFINENQSVEDIDFSGFFLDYAMSCDLNPIVSVSPKVKSVEIVSESFTNFNEEEINSKYSLIQNTEGYYKLCPIAVIQNGILTQIIDFDYVFSFPFYWLESLKLPFENVQE